MVYQRFWGALVALSVMTAARTVHAERRTFAEVYEPEVNGKDVMDLLLWNQLGHSWKKSALDETKFRIELQYGLTEQLDLTVYQNFEQGPATNQDLKFDSTAVELRYLLAPRGEWPVDVLVYLEAYKKYSSTEFELEPKLVVGKACGSWRWTANLFAEVEIDGSAEITPAFALAGGYDYSEKLRFGLEATSALAETVTASGGESHELVAAAGPTLNFQPSPKLFVTTHVGFGLTKAAADLQVNALLGIWFF